MIPNPTFRQSPQYFLNLPEPPADHPKATTGEVNVTLVLRRTDPTPDKAQKAQIGLCVFRGPAPEVVLGKKHKKTGPKVNALGEKPKGKPSTLKKKRRQAAQLLDGLAGPQHGWDNDLRSEDRSRRRLKNRVVPERVVSLLLRQRDRGGLALPR